MLTLTESHPHRWNQLQLWSREAQLARGSTMPCTLSPEESTIHQWTGEVDSTSHQWNPKRSPVNIANLRWFLLAECVFSCASSFKAAMRLGTSVLRGRALLTSDRSMGILQEHVPTVHAPVDTVDTAGEQSSAVAHAARRGGGRTPRRAQEDGKGGGGSTRQGEGRGE